MTSFIRVKQEPYISAGWPLSTFRYVSFDDLVGIAPIEISVGSELSVHVIDRKVRGKATVLEIDNFSRLLWVEISWGKELLEAL